MTDATTSTTGAPNETALLLQNAVPQQSNGGTHCWRVKMALQNSFVLVLAVCFFLIWWEGHADGKHIAIYIGTIGMGVLAILGACSYENLKERMKKTEKTTATIEGNVQWLMAQADQGNQMGHDAQLQSSICQHVQNDGFV